MDGAIVNDVPAADRGLAMVFQSYALYPHMSVRDNLAFGLENTRTPRAEIEARVAEAARMLRIEELLGRKPRQLSGGQRQRVAIGRAMVRRPGIFLLDEPLSNLDAELRVAMRAELAALRQRIGGTMIYVTHDQVEAMTLADRIVVLNGGRIEQIGAPLELFNEPQSRFVAGFIGSPRMNFLEAEAVNGSGATRLRFAGGAELPLRTGEEVAAGTRIDVGFRPQQVVFGGEGLPLTGDAGRAAWVGDDHPWPHRRGRDRNCRSVWTGGCATGRHAASCPRPNAAAPVREGRTASPSVAISLRRSAPHYRCFGCHALLKRLSIRPASIPRRPKRNSGQGTRMLAFTASAYVASVTAAMYACNRPHYDQPIKLKRNLVLSASPFLLEGDDGVSHVPVINPRLALQDPSKDWLVEAPGGLSLHDLKKNPEEITVDGWCREELPFTRLGNNEAVETMNIRRLTRVAGGQWVAFVKSRLWNEDPPHNQMYYPEGPFDIEDLGDGDPILMRDNGDAVPLGTLRDIYLHRDYETVSCG